MKPRVGLPVCRRYSALEGKQERKETEVPEEAMDSFSSDDRKASRPC